jgi:CRISPR-associated exonuclease Cas4
MINGTLVNYFFHCKRQCWLFYNRINMEDNSEDVRIGRVLHEIKNENESDIIDNIKVDKITSEYVVEIKKSDADILAAKEQLIFYLYSLMEKGIVRKGRLECIEKNKQNKKIHIIEPSEEEIKTKEKEYEKIRKFLELPIPPNPIHDKKCKKCAYYDYCYI